MKFPYSILIFLVLTSACTTSPQINPAQKNDPATKTDAKLIALHRDLKNDAVTETTNLWPYIERLEELVFQDLPFDIATRMENMQSLTFESRLRPVSGKIELGSVRATTAEEIHYGQIIATETGEWELNPEHQTGLTHFGRVALVRSVPSENLHECFDLEEKIFKRITAEMDAAIRQNIQTPPDISIANLPTGWPCPVE